MGALWFVVGLIALIVVIGFVVLMKYTSAASREMRRERQYRRQLASIENKKAKAIFEKDEFTAYQADREAVALRERYIAGKDVS